MGLKPKSANFDFLSAAHTGYRTAWDNHASLLRLAALPILIKIGCIAAIVFLGFNNQILRHGLMMIPSYFAEGFLIAYIIRTLHAGDDLAADVKQARRHFDDVLAGMIAFVLIQLVLAFVIGYTLSAMPDMPTDVAAADITADQQSNAMQGFFMALSVLEFMLWAFRFAWLHVPIAMGIPLSKFLVRIQSFSASFPMLGCWLAVFMPLAFAMVMISQGISMVLPETAGAESQLAVLVIGSFQGFCEIVINVVSAIAMSYGFKSLMDAK